LKVSLIAAMPGRKEKKRVFFTMASTSLRRHDPEQVPEVEAKASSQPLKIDSPSDLWPLYYHLFQSLSTD
jgi:hypothetical protein